MEIRLHNRDGGDLRLRYIAGKFWTFISDQPEYFEKFARFILEEDGKTIYAFDPPGGPFLYVGSIVGENYKITGIWNNLIFELKKIDKG